MDKIKAKYAVGDKVEISIDSDYNSCQKVKGFITYAEVRYNIAKIGGGEKAVQEWEIKKLKKCTD